MYDISRQQPIDNEEHLSLYKSECGNHQIIFVRNIIDQYEYISVSLDIARHCDCITGGGILLQNMYYKLNLYVLKILRHLAKEQELMNFHLICNTSVHEFFSKSTM